MPTAPSATHPHFNDEAEDDGRGEYGGEEDNDDDNYINESLTSHNANGTLFDAFSISHPHFISDQDDFHFQF